jgi:hypothetical protein
VEEKRRRLEGRRERDRREEAQVHLERVDRSILEVLRVSLARKNCV